MELIPEKKQEQELREIFDHVDSSAVAFHVDLFRIGFFLRAGSGQQQLADFFSTVAHMNQGRSLLFPTFNYDFTRTGVYDVASDPCQVGVLNEYARRRFPDQRTQTPIFNYCICDNESFSLSATNNPFSAASTFGALANQRVSVVFLGASFSANTFIHYVEETMNVGYRYIKPFPGVIRTAAGEQRIVLQYRVRPLMDGAAQYDWDRLAQDLAERKILHRFPLGKGSALSFRADLLSAYWCERLIRDEFYLLTQESKKKAEDLYAHFGKPLVYERMEKKEVA